MRVQVRGRAQVLVAAPTTRVREKLRVRVPAVAMPKLSAQVLEPGDQWWQLAAALLANWTKRLALALAVLQVLAPAPALLALVLELVLELVLAVLRVLAQVQVALLQALVLVGLWW
jgi:hypothetical protein